MSHFPYKYNWEHPAHVHAGGGVSSYNGLITEALGFTALQTDLLAMASGAFSLTATLIAIVFYRFTRWTLGSAAFCILPQLACVITMMSVTPTVHNKGKSSPPAVWRYAYLSRWCTRRLLPVPVHRPPGDHSDFSGDPKRRRWHQKEYSNRDDLGRVDDWELHRSPGILDKQPTKVSRLESHFRDSALITDLNADT